MTTLADVINRTRRRLATSRRHEITTLAAGIDASTTSLTFSSAVHIAANTRLSIELEDTHVTSSASETTATVIRALDGSTVAAHALGSVVRIGAVWTDFEIANAVNDELMDLSAQGLFSVRDVEFTYTPATQGYELDPTTEFMHVWRVTFDVAGPDQVWRIIQPSDYRVDTSANLADFPSGLSINLFDGGSPGQLVRVAYKSGFTPLTALANDVEVVSGLHAEAHDILSLGASMRLLVGLDVQRNVTTSQANPRRSDEVPPDAGARAIQSIGRQRDERINAERRRLAQRYPVSIT